MSAEFDGWSDRQMSRHVLGPREVTLADLLEVVTRRRALASLAMVAAIGATLVATAFAPAEYEATTSVVLINERESVLALMQSDRYAADVAVNAGLVASLGGGDPLLAAVAVKSHTVVGGQSFDPDGVARVVVTHPDPEVATLIAEGFVLTLNEYRPFMERVTYAKNWQAYYEKAQGDEAKAKAQLDALVANMAYYEFLDPRGPPAEYRGPSWAKSILVGVLGGTVSAAGVPLVVEAFQKAAREVRGRLRNVRQF